VRDRNAPARVLNAPLLGTVPIFKEVGADGPMPTISEPHSPAAESYHFIASSIRLALDRIDGTAVVITSAGAEDGKTVTALNLAIAASGAQHSPLLIDTDQRTRALSNLVGLATSRGLTDLDSGNGDIDEVVQSLIVDETITLNFVPAGNAPAGEAVRFFRSPAFTRAMPKIIDGSSLVIIDAPPILAAAEAMDITRQADGVLVVVRPGTSLRELADVAERVAMTDRPILGYVYNGADKESAYPTYSHSYGYGSDAGDTESS
jgi:Mrp family chromosome partitioning ATPase